MSLRASFLTHTAPPDPNLPGWGLGYPRSFLLVSPAQGNETRTGGLCFTASMRIRPPHLHPTWESGLGPAHKGPGGREEGLVER